MLRAVIRPLLVALLLSVSPLPMGAQETATLVADRLEIAADSRLIAEGGVEVFYQGRRLKAARIVFDRVSDRLLIEGPITLTENDGSIIILASQADLASDLTEGILTSARIVMDQQLQMAAAQIRRSGGRYTQLDRAVASACRVCEGSTTPLWEIRARRVTHDQLEQQIYFDHAQFRLAGVPIFYIPRLRMPDPTLERSSGFLNPSFVNSTAHGSGLRMPYFQTLGASRDLTITPYVTTQGTRSVQLRYRQAFRNGRIEVTGAVARDDLLPGDTRGFVLASGDFALPADFTLRFRGEVVSDDAYYLDYGVEAKDRLDSRLEVSRTRRDEHISARLIGYQSLRNGEVNATLPSLVSDFTFQRRFTLGTIGGEGGLRFQTHSHYRTSEDGSDANLDGIADGRDLSRASVRIDWRREWLLPGGIIGAVLGEASADVYQISQDDIWAGQRSRTHGAVSAELRWPWVKATTSGATHLVEPVAQLIWSPKTPEGLPNEDSALVEFDEGNLFSLNRFPGSDAVEAGVRANLGIGWTRFDPDGWSMGVTVGRVLRADDLTQFGPASGLDGSQSDWLAAARITMKDGLGLTGRVLFDDGLDATKAEMRLDLSRDRYGLSSSYIWAVADTLENRPFDTAELVVDGHYDVTGNWTVSGQSRYDFAASRASRAGFGVAYRNECIRVDLSLSHRFTSSTSVKPNTNFDLSVDLLGFGSGGEAGPARVCRR